MPGLWNKYLSLCLTKSFYNYFLAISKMEIMQYCNKNDFSPSQATRIAHVRFKYRQIVEKDVSRTVGKFFKQLWPSAIRKEPGQTCAQFCLYIILFSKIYLIQRNSPYFPKKWQHEWQHTPEVNVSWRGARFGRDTSIEIIWNILAV